MLKRKPKMKYSGGKRGWIGDNPYIYLDTYKIRSIGWEPRYNIKRSIKKTVNYILKNEWLLKIKN